jgi:hypothetical protein
LKQLTPEQATQVASILQKYKVDLSTVGSHNPWDSNSERAETFRQFIQQESPVLAAELSQHKAPSLAYMALKGDLAGGADIDINALPAELRQEFEQRDPELCANARASLEQRLLSKLEEEGAKARAYREGQKFFKAGPGSQRWCNDWNRANRDRMGMSPSRYIGR